MTDTEELGLAIFAFVLAMVCIGFVSAWIGCLVQ